MGKLNAGDLTERIRLLTPGAAQPDGRGGYLAAGLGVAADFWAKVRTLRATEKLALGQTLSSDAIQVVLRHDPGQVHTPRQRVSWQGATYAVQAVETDARNEYDTLTCFNSGK